MNNRTLIIAGALAVAAVIGYWALKQHTERSEVVGFVKDTGARLRESLAAEAGPPAAIGAEAIRKLESHLVATERNRAALKRLDAAGRQALLDAADEYLVTGQEILRRQAAAHRSRLLLADSTRALRAHFRSDRGAASWVREAVKLRGPMEKHYGDYRTAAETLDQLLEGFPASQSRIAGLVEGVPLVDAGAVAEARKRSQDTLARATAEVEAIRGVTSR